MGGKPSKNATFLNARETQHEPQFLLGVTAHDSAELQGPADRFIYVVLFLLAISFLAMLLIIFYNTYMH